LIDGIETALACRCVHSAARVVL